MDQQNSATPVVLPTSTLAIVSLIAGIFGFMGFPIIGTAVALFTGYSARKETRAIPPTHSGDGMATAGIVMGWIQVGLVVLGLCLLIAYLVFVVGLIGTMGIFGSGNH
jgi:hypothetical protein